MKTDSVKCLTPEVKWYEKNLPPSVIKYKIDDDKLMKSLMEIVDNDGDRMYHKTNLFCAMSGYKSHIYSQYKERYDVILDIINSILDEQNFNLSVDDIWVAKYESGEYARKHKHAPSNWSFCLYLNEGDGFPPLEIDDYGNVDPEKGLLVFFPGSLNHEVKSKEFEGSRYVCAGNIHSKSHMRTIRVGATINA